MNFFSNKRINYVENIFQVKANRNEEKKNFAKTWHQMNHVESGRVYT